MDPITIVMIIGMVITTLTAAMNETGNSSARSKSSRIKSSLQKLRAAVNKRQAVNNADIAELQRLITDANNVVYKVNPSVRNKLRNQILQAQQKVDELSQQNTDLENTYNARYNTQPTVVGGMTEFFTTDKASGLTNFQQNIEKDMKEIEQP